MNISIDLEVLSPLIIGSSEPAHGLAKAYRELDGRPVVTGSALKGSLRESSRIFLDSYRKEIEVLFGTQHSEGKIVFSSLTLDLEQESSEIGLERTHITMDRKTRTTSKGKLFKVRAVRPGVKFTGRLFIRGTLSEQERAILSAIVKHTRKMGAMRSAGYGTISLTLKDYSEDEKFCFPSNSSFLMVKYKLMVPFVVTNERVKTYLYRSADFIPGSALRGAYASTLNPRSQEFREIFIQEKVKFPFLYPLIGETRGLPLPETMLQEKHSTADYEDTLVELLVQKTLLKEGYRTVISKKSAAGKKLDRGKGWFVPGRPSPGYSGKRYFSTQVELESRTRNAKDGSLRTYSAQRYEEMAGIIRASDPELLRSLDSSWLTVGNSKSRGFGIIEPTEVKQETLTFSEDVESFSGRVNNALEAFGISCNKTFIPVLLVSDLVPQRNQGFEDLLGDDFSFELARFKPSKISGWNNASNCPKSAMNTLGAGSVMVYSSSRSASEISSTLEKLLISGLGAFTGSGYGEFTIYKT